METGEVQDTRFQEREWQLQRAAWGLLFLGVVASLLGAFGGPGPLSLSMARSTGQAIQAQYYRFARLGGEGPVTVTVTEAGVRDGTVDVWWNSAYLDQMAVNSVTPEPESTTAIGDRVRYRFAAEPREGPLTFTFDLTPDGIGSKHAEVAVADGTQRLTYRQFIYP